MIWRPIKDAPEVGTPVVVYNGRRTWPTLFSYGLTHERATDPVTHYALGSATPSTLPYPPVGEDRTQLDAVRAREARRRVG